MTSTAFPGSLGLAPTGADDLRAFARETCEAVCGLARLAYAAFAVFDPENGRLELVATHGETAPANREDLLTAEEVALAVRAAEVGGYAEAAGLLAVGAPAGPVRVVLLGCRHEDAFGREASVIPLLEGSARIAGLAVRDRLRLAEEHLRRAECERTELACTIHEDVVQRMFGVSLALDDDGPLEAGLREMCATELERALGDLRAIIRRSPQDITVRRAGLDEALAQLASEGVAVDAACTVLTATSAQQAIARSVLTEAVCNARKHAPSSRVEVSVREADGLLKLSVVNDGAPGDRRKRSPRSGVGLQLAATEAAQGGGVLEHGPTGTGHWVVHLALPLEERDEHDCHRRRPHGADR